MFTTLLLLSALLQTGSAHPASAGTPPAVKAQIPESAYAPLTLYNGTWKVVPGHHNRPYDTLINHCQRADLFYTCTQNVDGTTLAFMIFIPSDVAGQYYVQGVLPSGEALGRTGFTIDHGVWTYNSHEEHDGKTVYYRTVNTFTGKDKIHFSQQTSTDGVHFEEKSSGDEQRVP